MPPAVIDGADPDSLISRLARPLAAADREAFRAAAQDALAQVPCLGAGSIYRCVASLQRTFRTPPTDHRASWGHRAGTRTSKLRDAPPIDSGDRRRRQVR